MYEEMGSIEDNRTWDLVDLPTDKRPIGLKWVCRLKKDETGAVVSTRHALSQRDMSRSTASTTMRSSLLSRGWSQCDCCLRSLHKRDGRSITWM
ncbi:hypothetical protein E2562_004369 [Oryza meyeriana var. granulata]|uniref:Reverse transcriptase Ty1/copia-type domain-containing protein n=1 Tax=Oryza meyeriana var. granulata TaxID=110450 RepID=A0A6G1CZ56_9ORYZ|nr:hypothetical protein E2562_004369 [Oryza meyeriana var. granulata]